MHFKLPMRLAWIECLEPRRLFAGVADFSVSPAIDVQSYAATYEYFLDDTGYHWRAQLEEYNASMDWYVTVKTVEGRRFNGGSDELNNAFAERLGRNSDYHAASQFRYEAINFPDDTFEVKAVRLADGESVSGYEPIRTVRPTPGLIDLDFASHFAARYDLPDGKVLLFGQPGHLDRLHDQVSMLGSQTLARYNADGTLDTSFAGQGYVLPLGRAGYGPDAEIGVAPDGTIVVWNGLGAVYRFAADGTELAPVLNVRDAAFNSASRLYYIDGDDNRLRRLSADGTPDDSFAAVALDAGASHVAVGLDAVYVATDDAIRAIDLQGDSRWTRTLAPPGTQGQIVELRVDAGDRLIIGWNYTRAPREQDILFPWDSNPVSGVGVARLSADGALDATFGDDGFVTFDRDPSTLYAIDLLPDGAIRLLHNGARSGVGFTTINRTGAVLSRQFADFSAMLVLDESPFSGPPAVEITWNGSTFKMAQGQWIVEFDANYGIYALNDLLASLNLGLRGELFMGNWVVVQAPPTLAPEALEAALQTLPTYRGMTPNYVGTCGAEGPDVGPTVIAPASPAPAAPVSPQQDDPIVTPRDEANGAPRPVQRGNDAPAGSSWSTYFSDDDDLLGRLPDGDPIVA